MYNVKKNSKPYARCVEVGDCSMKTEKKTGRHAHVNRGHLQQTECFFLSLSKIKHSLLNLHVRSLFCWPLKQFRTYAVFFLCGLSFLYTSWNSLYPGPLIPGVFSWFKVQGRTRDSPGTISRHMPLCHLLILAESLRL